MALLKLSSKLLVRNWQYSKVHSNSVKITYNNQQPKHTEQQPEQQSAQQPKIQQKPSNCPTQQQINTQKRGISLTNSFAVLDPEHVESSDSGEDTDIDTQEAEQQNIQEENKQYGKAHNQMQTTHVKSIPNYSILKRDHYSMPESFKHLLRDTENFAKSFSKRCAESLTLSDEDTPEDRDTPSIIELQEFSNKLHLPNIPEKSTQNQPMIGDNEGFKVVHRRKINYVKNPELQRATRSIAKASQDEIITNIND